MKSVWRIGALLVIAVSVGVVFLAMNRQVKVDAAPGPITLDQPIAPPPPHAEIMPPEPSKEHVWIPGYWERDPNKWVWVQGRWIKPPILPARWVNGYWMVEEGRYHWHPGHWGVGGSGVIVNKPYEPPPALQQVVPAPPSPDQTWVAGRGEWNGHWAWTLGISPPNPRRPQPGSPGIGRRGCWGYTPGYRRIGRMADEICRWRLGSKGRQRLFPLTNLAASGPPLV